MSRALPFRTTRTTVRSGAVVLALGIALSGCGAGLNAQTYQERATADATNERIGAIAVRNLRVLPPAAGSATYAVGSTARVSVVFVNEGTEADRLTNVTSTGASGVALIGPSRTLSVPAQATVSNYSFELRGLTSEVGPGQYVQLELTFADNGSRSLLVPVQLTGSPGPRRENYKIGETDSSGQVIVEDETDGVNETRPVTEDDSAATAGLTLRRLGLAASRFLSDLAASVASWPRPPCARPTTDPATAAGSAGSRSPSGRAAAPSARPGGRWSRCRPPGPCPG